MINSVGSHSRLGPTNLELFSTHNGRLKDAIYFSTTSFRHDVFDHLSTGSWIPLSVLDTLLPKKFGVFHLPCVDLAQEEA